MSGIRNVTVRLLPETNHLLVPDPNGTLAGYAALPSLAVRPEALGTIADWLVTRLRVR